MPLAAGTAVGAFEVLAWVGAGGMGEVYRARDTTLGREVALKVLPATVTHDPERVARFRREALLLASLNHPHIAAIHAVAEAAGVTALALEFVDGPTLADRIAEGPLAIDEARTIARQIADALEAAHAQGIVHRDLKPSNIKVRQDGTVKVLDFGLAKALETPETPAAALANSPTITTPAMTQANVVLGTAAYMSPEQAVGKYVDKRADVWAFGVVLFEMLTGRKPFEGETVTHVVAAVLRSVPDWSLLPAQTPPAMRRLLRRCLEKNPRARLRDIADGRLELDESDEAETTTPVAPSRRARWSRIAAPALLALLVGAGVATAVRISSSVPSPSLARLMITPVGTAAIRASGSSRDLAISPDGKQVAYVGGNGSALYVRALDRIDPIQIHEGGMPHHPFFSPDGGWVAFTDGSSALRRVPVAGGAVETICRVTEPGVRATWGGDGTIVVDGYGSLWRVSATGGEPELLAAPDSKAGELWYDDPEFMPEQRAILHDVWFAGGQVGTALLDLRSGARKILMREGSQARYVQSGHLVFRAGTTLRVIAYDVRKSETVGTPVPIAEPILVTPFGSYPDFDVSANGTLVYVPASAPIAARRLVWVRRDGTEEPAGLPVRAYTYPSLSPNGKQAALDIRDQENDTWIWDIERQTLRRLTFDPLFNQYAVWTPDGDRIVNFAQRGRALVWQRADGAGVPEELMRSDNVRAPTSISPDGTRLVFRGDYRETGHDVMMLTLDRARKVEPLLQSRFNELNAEISPDGRWLAFESDESGRYEIFVRPFPDVTEGRWQVSSDGGTKPRWARNGQELFYVAPGGAMMAIPVEVGRSFTFGTPAKLFEGGYYVGAASNVGRTYDVAPDGARFLMIKPAEASPTSIMVVLNWFSELKRLVPPH